MITMAIVGGTLIGLAAVWMYLSLGRVAGISGIAAQALKAPGQAVWAVLFVIGLGAGGWLARLTIDIEAPALDLGLPYLIAGGLIVGFGTRLGSGCTSGHGVCGIARFSKRSMVATVTFVAIGMVTASLLHGVLGGAA